MKKKYYVSTEAQDNRDHEVHVEGCIWLPRPYNRIDLGECASCHDAVRAAKKYYHRANGCVYCSEPCHAQ